MQIVPDSHRTSAPARNSRSGSDVLCASHAGPSCFAASSYIHPRPWFVLPAVPCIYTVHSALWTPDRLLSALGSQCPQPVDLALAFQNCCLMEVKGLDMGKQRSLPRACLPWVEKSNQKPAAKGRGNGVSVIPVMLESGMQCPSSGLVSISDEPKYNGSFSWQRKPEVVGAVKDATHVGRSSAQGWLGAGEGHRYRLQMPLFHIALLQAAAFSSAWSGGPSQHRTAFSIRSASSVNKLHTLSKCRASV